MVVEIPVGDEGEILSAGSEKKKLVDETFGIRSAILFV